MLYRIDRFKYEAYSQAGTFLATVYSQDCSQLSCYLFRVPLRHGWYTRTTAGAVAASRLNQ